MDRLIVTFTVFTPTFNRAHTLQRVFDSLCAQTFRDFEWLVVDDGSTDGTEDLIRRLAREATFPIRYFRQENSGKHVATNLGVAEARGRFFLTLDSDDACVPEALERLLFHWNTIPAVEQERFSAVTVLCQDTQGRVIGDPFPSSPLDSDSTEIQYRYRVRGEKWGFQRTDVMREFPFPVYGSERFVTEAVVWRAIGKRYHTRYVNESLRIYFEPTATSGPANLTHTSAVRQATSQRLLSQATLNEDMHYFRFAPLAFFKAAANFTRCSLHTASPVSAQWRGMHGIAAKVLWVLALPVGAALFLRDRRRQASDSHLA